MGAHVKSKNSFLNRSLLLKFSLVWKEDLFLLKTIFLVLKQFWPEKEMIYLNKLSIWLVVLKKYKAKPRKFPRALEVKKKKLPPMKVVKKFKSRKKKLFLLPLTCKN